MDRNGLRSFVAVAAALKTIMKTSRSKSAAVTLALMGAMFTAASTQATLVNVSIYYPDLATLYLNGGDTTVSGAIEYPSMSGNWDVDITGTQIVFHNLYYTGLLGAGSFNGWIVTILSGETFLSATANGSSDFNPNGISIVGGNKLHVDYASVSVLPGKKSIIDIQTAAVPEPSTYFAGALLALPFGLQGIRWLRNRKQAV